MKPTLLIIVILTVVASVLPANEQGNANSVSAAERQKLSGEYRVRPHAPLGQETALSREVYRRLLQYVRLTAPRFKDWPHAEGCRYHKKDDHNELAVRQNATVALGYSVLLAGDYDERVSGVPRERIRQDLIGLLRYLAITHVANSLPTGDGKPWGDHWQSAFWAGIAGHGAWLSWDYLDDDLKVMTARTIIHEADRFNTRPPDTGYKGDTKAEENAWNSEGIALAACMFPEHPNAKVWHERAIVYMINSFTREADKTSDRIVDKRPAKDRIQAVTIYPDFTLENHNRVHPDYLGCISLLLRNALLYQAAGLPLPKSTFFNVPETFVILKRLTAANGSFFYINGQDWWPHRHDDPLMLGGFMGVLTKDPDAAFLERASLDFFARMHARFTDGSAWQPCEYNYANAEEEIIARYAELYLLHRLLGEGPAPAGREEFLTRQSGAFCYDTGGFVIHRTPEKFASFAWTNGAMGLVFPSDDTWFTSPGERGMTGRIACQGLKDTAPKVVDHRVRTHENGFSLATRFERCEGKIEQSVAVWSLPGAPVLYLERLVAREAVTVGEVATGIFSVLNEDAPGICPNRRILHHAAGRDEVIGRAGAPPRMLRWKSPWANIDGRMGILTTAGSVAYQDNNTYQRSRLEEEVIANHRTGVGTVSAGKSIGCCAVAYIPNQHPDETAKSRLEILEVPEIGILAVRLDATIVTVNLGGQAAKATVFDRAVSLNPLETAVFGK